MAHTWDYRLLDESENDGGVRVIEVHYDDAGLIWAWAEATPCGETIMDLEADLAAMTKAADVLSHGVPILKPGDLP